MAASPAVEPFPVDRYLTRIARANPAPLAGQVARVVGLVVESEGPHASVGEICEVRLGGGGSIPMEVVGFRDGRLLSVPLADMAGICPGDRLIASGAARSIGVGDGLLGRVIDGLGRPIDGLGPLETDREAPLQPASINPMDREPVTRPLSTGVRAIDAMLTCGKGQRIGVFGGSGVGKSTLLGMIARGTEADVVVLALVGERGREVRSFLEHELGPEGLAKSVVVVSTSDSPALARLRAAYAATSIAEGFRDAGRNVMLMMDSVTRFAMAQREVGLAAGEPPTAKGYPPSVFGLLPGLLERAGSIRSKGSITAFYTVLVEGDDNNEPISDAVRGILDGHIVLSRELAGRNHYPAIDILGSISRTMPAVTSAEHRAKAGQVREWMTLLRDSEDLISVGAYTPGSQPRLDAAIQRRDGIRGLLCQPADMLGGLSDAVDALQSL